MKNKFLYEPVGRIGILQSKDSDMTWMEDSEPILLKEKFTNASFSELIELLIDLFSSGEPNYIELSVLFRDTQNKTCSTVKEINDNELLVLVSPVLTKCEDIERIEMTIDNEKLTIKNLSIYMKILPELDLNEMNISERYAHNNKKLEILLENCKITILKS